MTPSRHQKSIFLLLGALSSLFLASACAVAPEGLSESREAWDDARPTYAQPRELEASEPVEIPRDLDEALQLAWLRNPSVAAAFEGWRMAIAEVTIAQKLPEPKLTLASFLSEVETRVGPMDGRIALAQSFPWFGVLDLKGDEAFERSEAARENLETARLEVAASLREAWYELVYLGEAVRVTEAHISIVDHWEDVARARFEANLARGTDLIRVQIELGRLEDRRRNLADRFRPLHARLGALLDVDAEALAGLRPGLGELPLPVEVDVTALAAELAATNPDLRALEHIIRAADKGRELADKQFFPRFTIGGDYTFVGDAVAPVNGSGDDAFAVSLGLDLPIWRRAYRAGQSKTDAMARSTRLSRESKLNELEARLEEQGFLLRDSARRKELYGVNLIPKGEEALESLDSGYQAGDAGYIDLVDAERVLLEFQLQLARARVDSGLALARIERLSGVPLIEPGAAPSNPTEN